MQERRDWEREQRRNRIIELAEGIFAEKGYDAATVDEIVAAAGYTKRSFYNYFIDKEEILLAIVLRGLTALNQRLAEALMGMKPKAGLGPPAAGDATLGPLQGSLVRKLAETYFRFFIENPTCFSLIMRYESRLCIYYGDKSRRGATRDACQEASDTTASLVTEAIRACQEDGSIRNDLAPRQLMLIVWGQISGFLQIIFMRREHFEDAFGISYQDLFEAFCGMLEKSLSA